MRILVTGSRGWKHSAVIEGALENLLGSSSPDEEFVVICGYDPDRKLPKGADEIAYLWALSFAASGVTIEPWPAHWDVYGKAAGFIRNQNMVDHAKPDVCASFIQDDSPGATDCANRAAKAGIPVRYFRESKLGEYLGES